MSDDTTKLDNFVQIDEAQVRGHLTELVRGSVEETLNGLLDAEADQLADAKRQERNEKRRETRVGHYERKLHTSAGGMTLKVPKLRQLKFETSIIERYKRRESSVEEGLIEMYLAGASTRRVEDIIQALRGTKVSPSTVSTLNERVYAHIEAWRNRPIEPRFPYFYLDGLFMKMSFGDGVHHITVLVTIEVDDDGFGEVLGVCQGGKEDKGSRFSFLRHLKERGLPGPELCISDACLGLRGPLGNVFPEATWQSFIVHFYRNVSTQVPYSKVREVTAMMKATHAQEDRLRRRTPQADEAPERSPARGRRHRGQAELLPLSAGALAAHPHQQSARAHPP